MTTFDVPGSGADLAPVGVKPWSRAAVAAFVLSLFGCTLIGGGIAIVLSVVGILKTSGGKRRGMALAISAIPIAIISAGGGAATYFVIVVGRELNASVEQLPVVLKSENYPGSLRQLATDELNSDVDDARMLAWLREATEERGSIVSVTPSESYTSQSGNREARKLLMIFDGKFINGNAEVKVVWKATDGYAAWRVDGIEIDARPLRASGP